jgi:hypothetical protein
VLDDNLAGRQSYAPALLTMVPSGAFTRAVVGLDVHRGRGVWKWPSTDASPPSSLTTTALGRTWRVELWPKVAHSATKTPGWTTLVRLCSEAAARIVTSPRHVWGFHG